MFTDFFVFPSLQQTLLFPNSFRWKGQQGKTVYKKWYQLHTLVN